MIQTNPIQIVAYLVNFALCFAVWRYKHLRIYAFALLASDLLRFAFGFVPLHRDGSARDLCLYGVDGAILLVSPIVLAWALRLPARPMVGFLTLAWVIAMLDVHRGLHDEAGRVYLAALTTSHIYATIGPVASRKLRRNLDRESVVLLGLAITGTTGAIVAQAWGRWDLVNIGNIIAHVVLGNFAFFAGRGENHRQR